MKRTVMIAGIAITGYTAYRVYEEGASRSVHHIVGKPLVILAPKLGNKIEELTHDMPKASKRKVKKSLNVLRDIAGAHMGVFLLQAMAGKQ